MEKDEALELLEQSMDLIHRQEKVIDSLIDTARELLAILNKDKANAPGLFLVN